MVFDFDFFLGFGLATTPAQAMEFVVGKHFGTGFAEIRQLNRREDLGFVKAQIDFGF